MKHFPPNPYFCWHLSLIIAAFCSSSNDYEKWYKKTCIFDGRGAQGQFLVYARPNTSLKKSIQLSNSRSQQYTVGIVHNADIVDTVDIVDIVDTVVIVNIVDTADNLDTVHTVDKGKVLVLSRPVLY